MPDWKLIALRAYRFSDRDLFQNFINIVIWNRWIDYLLYGGRPGSKNIEYRIEREVHAR